MKKTYTAMNILICLFFAAILINVFTHAFSGKSSVKSSVINYNSGWTYENGSEADLMQLDFKEDHTLIKRYISGSEASGMSICFVSRFIDFNVYIDDVNIYEFSPESSKFYGKYYGSYVHTVKLPYFEGIKQLSIDCNCRDINKNTGFEQMVLQDSGNYVTEFFRKAILNILVCVVTFIFGVLLIIFGLVQRSDKDSMNENVSLGTMTIILSIWSAPNPGIFQMMTGNSAALRTIDFLALALLPAPVISFVASFTKSRKTALMNVFIMISILNFAANVILVTLGILDYKDLLIVSHLLVIITAFYTAYLIVAAIRNDQVSILQRNYFVVSMGFIFIAGMIDMYRYYFTNNDDASAAVRIGLLFFTSILALYEFFNLVDMQVKVGKSDLMRRLALEDALTGMNNRTAFNAHEASLLERDKGKVIFVHFDVNGLKQVNDNHGHEAGDTHIKAAAKVLKNSFGKYGTCYRVGGDEFFAILEGKNAMDDYDVAINDFYDLQDEYNRKKQPPVNLAIAHGMAVYYCKDKNPEEAEKNADSRMYENKKAMKMLRN